MKARRCEGKQLCKHEASAAAAADDDDDDDGGSDPDLSIVIQQQLGRELDKFLGRR